MSTTSVAASLSIARAPVRAVVARGTLTSQKSGVDSLGRRGVIVDEQIGDAERGACIPFLGQRLLDGALHVVEKRGIALEACVAGGQRVRRRPLDVRKWEKSTPRSTCEPTVNVAQAVRLDATTMSCASRRSDAMSHPDSWRCEARARAGRPRIRSKSVEGDGKPAVAGVSGRLSRSQGQNGTGGASYHLIRRRAEEHRDRAGCASGRR